MALILLELTKHHVAFPDMKNANWLIDKGVLKIADTKTFISTNDNGFVNVESTAKDNIGRKAFARTTGWISPEMNNYLNYDIPFSADKMHAYLLGVNLSRYFELIPRSSSINLNLRYQISDLRDQLLENNYVRRISIKDAYDKFQCIQKKPILHEILAKVDIYRTGLFDQKMDEFKEKHTRNIDRIKTIEDAIALEKKLNLIHDNLQKSDYKRLLFADELKQYNLTDIEARTNLVTHLIQSRQPASEKDQVMMIINKINETRYGSEDLIMTNFVNHYTQKIEKETNIEQLVAIQRELLLIDDNLSKNKTSLNFIRNKIKTLRNGYHYQGNAKADLIEKQMQSIPIHERVNIKGNPQQIDTITNLHKALAAKRYFFATVAIDHEKKLDPRQAAGTYTAFMKLQP